MNMDIVNPEIEKYIDSHTSEESELLSQLNRQTHLHELMPRMLSGHVQGRFLSLISKMVSPKYILEIGTFTGYSAICLAEGLQNDGELHTIDINEELKNKNSLWFKKAGYEGKIIQHIGNALEIIPVLNYDFDIVFIDADKSNYANYYNLVIDRLKSGAVILADNVLWSGKVLDNQPEKTDKDTEALKEFNKLVQEDARVENVMVSIRDGILLIRKK